MLDLLAPGGQDRPQMDLTDRERAILSFEQRWWQLPGSKEAAIREHLDISAQRYYRVLADLLDHPGAEAHDPLLVRRLRRTRERRLRARFEGRRADPGRR